MSDNPPGMFRLWFDLWGANDAGEMRHAQTVVRELEAAQGFTVLDARPQSMGDGWEFWIRSATPPALPEYIRIAKWKDLP